MNRAKLTTPGVLLLVVAACTCGVFLLDVCYLQPHVLGQKTSALREQAGRTEHAAKTALRSEQEQLLRLSATTAGSAEIRTFLNPRTHASRFHSYAQRVFDPARIELAWLSDAVGGVVCAWSKSPRGAAEPTAWRPPRKCWPKAAERVADARTSTGLMGLPDGLVIFARHPLRGGRDGKLLGHLWIARRLSAGMLKRIGSASSGKLTFVRGGRLPQGQQVTDCVSHSLWMEGKDHLVVAWKARDGAGEALGYFRSDVPVMQVRHQALAARTTILIIVSLSVVLALLLVLGTQMLLAGPLERLLGRVGQLESSQGASEEFTRELHGEPLVLARRLKLAFGRAAQKAMTDPVTGLASRRHFERVLEDFYHQAKRYNRRLSLMVVEVGFAAGGTQSERPAADEWLAAAAGAMEESCRKADLPARYDGNRFAILLPETPASNAGVMAERIHTSVCRHVPGVTVSIGIADLNSVGVDGPGALASLAERTMDCGKQDGPGRTVQAHELEGLQGPTGGEGEEDSLMVELHGKFVGLDSRMRSLLLEDIEGVVGMLERRDDHMANHARKVRRYAVLIAREMELPQRVIGHIQIAAALHDIGMAAMPDSVLLCSGRLDEQQLRLMRRHPLLGVRIMEDVEFLEQEIPAVRYHHERYDGKGYPEGIAGSAIPLTARILAVAEAFDGMTSPRTFRDATTQGEALAELMGAAGTEFDPLVVDALLAVAVRLGDGLCVNACKLRESAV